MASIKGRVAMKATFVISMAMLLGGCMKSAPTPEDVKVGMTYAEVESSIGKPKATQKGYTDLVFVDTPELSKLKEIPSPWMETSENTKGELARLLVDEFNSLTAKDMAVGMPSVGTKGQEVYTTWIMDGKPRCDTIPVQIPQLIKKQGRIYLERFNYRNPSFEYQPYVLRVSIARFNSSGGSGKVWAVEGKVDGVQVAVVHYLVRRAFAIRFDSSSGRVVSSEYAPVEVVRVAE